MKTRSKTKIAPFRKLSADAKFAQRKTNPAKSKRNPNDIPADRGAEEKESSSQGSE